MKNDTTGSRMSVVASVVVKADQPPVDGGSLRERRASTVCQSVDTMSTLKPPRSSSCLATGAVTPAAVSLACISSTGVPS